MIDQALPGLLLLLFCPLALIAAIVRHAQSQGIYERLHHSVLLWLLIQTTLAHVLGMGGFLHTSVILTAQAILLAVGVYLLWNSRSTPTAIHSLGARWFMAAYLIIPVGILAYFFTQPFTEHDTISYHLPAIANWIQTHRFAPLAQYLNDHIGYYPYGWEALSSLAMIACRSDVVVFLLNASAWALLGLAVAALAAGSGANSIRLLLPPILLLSMPITLFNVSTLHTDIQMTAFFMSGLLLVDRFDKSPKALNLALLISATGLVCACKASGVLYAAPLCLLALIVIVRKRPQGRAVAAGLAIGMLIFGLTGGYWFARNWLAIGNPLGYPEVRVGSWLVFPGPMDAAFLRDLSLAGRFQLANAQHWRVLLHSASMWLGAPLLVLAMMSLVAVAQGLARRDARMGVMLGLLAYAVVAYWFSPFSADNGLTGGEITGFIGQQMRFALPALSILALLATQVRFHKQWLHIVVQVAGLVALLMVALQMRLLWAVLWSALVVAGIALALWFIHGKGRKRTVATALGIVVLGVLWNYRVNHTEESYGALYSVLDEIPNEEPVGYALSFHSYPLYGPDWKQKTVFLDADKWKTEQEMIAALKRQKIMFFAAGPLIGVDVDRAQSRWLDSRSLKPILGKDVKREMVIYQVVD